MSPTTIKLALKNQHENIMKQQKQNIQKKMNNIKEIKRNNKKNCIISFR